MLGLGSLWNHFGINSFNELSAKLHRETQKYVTGIEDEVYEYHVHCVVTLTNG
jgi:hypothetical protein